VRPVPAGSGIPRSMAGRPAPGAAAAAAARRSRRARERPEQPQTIPFEGTLPVQRPRYETKEYDLGEPGRARPVRAIHLPALSAFGVRQRWRDGVSPVLVAGGSISAVESCGRSSCLIAMPWSPSFPLCLGPPPIGGSCGDRAPSGAAVAWRAGAVPSAFKRGFG